MQEKLTVKRITHVLLIRAPYNWNGYTIGLLQILNGWCQDRVSAGYESINTERYNYFKWRGSWSKWPRFKIHSNGF
jgi:hypothetical protein